MEFRRFRSLYGEVGLHEVGDVVAGGCVGCRGKRGVCKSVEKSGTSKVVVFSWKVLINRIPTRDNLALRNVLVPETSNLCVLCDMKEESSLHFFLHCDVAYMVWMKVMRWLDCFFLSPPNLFVHWECLSGRERNKKVSKGLRLIWHTAIWVLWLARKNEIFKGINCEVEKIVEEIKVMSWRWMLNRTHNSACMFYEWCWHLKYCLER